MRPLDIAFKELARTSLLELLRWLLPGSDLESVAELPSELPAPLRRVDLLVRRTVAGQAPELVVLACQAQRDPGLHASMLLRAALAHVHHGLPVRTVVLALTEAAAVSEEYVYGAHRQGVLVHAVEVRRLYQEGAEQVLRGGPEALLPLVPGMEPRGCSAEQVLQEVVERIAELAGGVEVRRLYVGWAATFATLRLSSQQVRVMVEQVARRRPWMLDALQDLPLLRDTYQEGLEKGRKEGLEKGLEKGRKEGLEKGLEQGLRDSLLLIYRDRFGGVPPRGVEGLSRVGDAARLQALFSLFLSGGAAEIEERLSG